MQNTLELVSSNKSAYVFSFPLGFLTLWSMPVLHQPGSACNFSGSCHVLSAKSYQVHRIMIFGNWDELGICSIGIVPCRFALAVPYSNLRYWHKTGKILGCFFQMFKVSHVFHHLFPSFSPFLSSMFSHFSPMKFTISGAKPWSRLRFRLHDKISWMLRAPKGSERPEICDVAHSESLDMIGHLRCEWIRFRLFDMNRHSEWIWYYWKNMEKSARTEGAGAWSSGWHS